MDFGQRCGARRGRSIPSRVSLAGVVASFWVACQENKKSRRRSCFIGDMTFFLIILVAKQDTLPANWHPTFWHMTDKPHSMALRVGWRLGGAMQRIEAGGRNKSGVERHPLFILIASSRIAHWNSWFSGGLPAVTVHPLGRCGPWPEQQQPPARRSRKPIRDNG